MSLIWKDRVAEISTTTGTGALTLAGALTSFRAFSSVCATNDTVYYVITAVGNGGEPTGDWETGLGTYSGANTLTRTTVLDSSNAGAAVNFGAGTKRVVLAQVAAQSDGGRSRIGALAADGSTTVFTFSGIPAGYRRLAVDCWFTIPTNATFTIKCNNDSSALYQMQRNGYENGVINLQQLAQTSWNPTGGTFNSGVALDFALTFGNYASGNKKLARVALSAGTTTSGQLATATHALLYDSTTAVTRLDFTFSSAPTDGEILLFGEH